MITRRLLRSTAGGGSTATAVAAVAARPPPARVSPLRARSFSSLPQPAVVEVDDEGVDDRQQQVQAAVRVYSHGRSSSSSIGVTRDGSHRKRTRLEELRELLDLENRTGRMPDLQPADTKKAASEGGQKQESWEELLRLAKTTLLRTSAATPQPTRQDMLTDSFSRHHTYLRISLSERCNLRCRYCMPPEGVPLQPKEELLSDGEILELVGLFVEGGVDKVRLTGGEPLLRPTLPDLISSISSKHPTITSVGITTNGLTLSRSLPRLLDSGLTHANISLDTLQDDKFVDITRRRGLSQVMRAIDDSLEQFGARFGSGNDDGGGGLVGRIKINCVVMNSFNDTELRDFVLLTRDRPIDVRFIEWMPFNDNGWNKGRFLGYKDMMKTIRGEEEVDGDEDMKSSGAAAAAAAAAATGSSTMSGQRQASPASLNGVGPLHLERLSDGPNDTTKWWRVPNHRGRIGFITSMSDNFCGTCNRLRITADGQLKVCLFGSREVSLRDAMRAGISREDLALLVRAAVGRKTFALGGHGTPEGIARANDNRPMTLIGG